MAFLTLYFDDTIVAHFNRINGVLPGSTCAPVENGEGREIKDRQRSCETPATEEVTRPRSRYQPRRGRKEETGWKEEINYLRVFASSFFWPVDKLLANFISRCAWKC